MSVSGELVAIAVWLAGSVWATWRVWIVLKDEPEHRRDAALPIACFGGPRRLAVGPLHRSPVRASTMAYASPNSSHGRPRGARGDAGLRRAARAEVRPMTTRSGLDRGIRAFVEILQQEGVETVQSCQGGAVHAYELPTIDLVGGPGAGYHALGIALNYGLPVLELRWSANMHGGHLERPVWSLVFRDNAITWEKNQATSLAARELIYRRRRR